jgi:hypothetical protein
MAWQRNDAASDSVAHGFGTVSGECRAILLPLVRSVAGHWRTMEKHREAGRPFDQCANRRTVQTQDQVALPVARDSSVISLCGPFADHDLGGDEGFAASALAEALRGLEYKATGRLLHD